MKTLSAISVWFWLHLTVPTWVTRTGSLAWSRRKNAESYKNSMPTINPDGYGLKITGVPSCPEAGEPPCYFCFAKKAILLPHTANTHHSLLAVILPWKEPQLQSSGHVLSSRLGAHGICSGTWWEDWWCLRLKVFILYMPTLVGMGCMEKSAGCYAIRKD